LESQIRSALFCHVSEVCDRSPIGMNRNKKVITRVFMTYLLVWLKEENQNSIPLYKYRQK
jgi:hypothetical protein